MTSPPTAGPGRDVLLWGALARGTGPNPWKAATLRAAGEDNNARALLGALSDWGATSSGYRGGGSSRAVLALGSAGRASPLAPAPGRHVSEWPAICGSKEGWRREGGPQRRWQICPTRSARPPAGRPGAAPAASYYAPVLPSACRLVRPAALPCGRPARRSQALSGFLRRLRCRAPQDL